MSVLNDLKAARVQLRNAAEEAQAALDQIEAAIAALEGVEPEPQPEPHDCTSCGTSNNDCLENVLSGDGKACCPTCLRTDTHGALR